MEKRPKTEKRNILIGVTGSVAAIKVGEFIERLRDASLRSGFEIDLKVVATKSAKSLFTSSAVDSMVDCEDEFREWNRIGDDILHISLRQWADLYIILPLTANTLGKLSNGLCDNILLSPYVWVFGRHAESSAWICQIPISHREYQDAAEPYPTRQSWEIPPHDYNNSSQSLTFPQTNIARAWDFKKPIIVCPAMNNFMWEHPITLRQIETIQSFGYKVVLPIEKKLACGEFGMGGMQEIDRIVEIVILELTQSQHI
ncbi:putative flavoprotein [Cryptosporidium canis]|uniref:Flavoprotein n=1 Tax=Cryptosporidium canis TaxID=195482 RepID=A0ABQ8P1P6_9CRYT|nr:putative flavoprotein [Cryptosporidium canis]